MCKIFMRKIAKQCKMSEKNKTNEYISYSWIGRLNIVKRSRVLPNLTYRFNAIPNKIPASYLWI